MPTLPAAVLTDFVAALFRDAGVPEGEAADRRREPRRRRTSAATTRTG